MDIVDDILRHLHIRSRVTYRLEEAGYWGHRLVDDGQFQLHCVLAGRCQYQRKGAKERFELSAGDVLLLPRGGPASVQDISGRQPRRTEHDLRGGLTCDGHQAQAPRVIVLGGMLELGGQTRHPLISGLPDVTLVRNTELLQTGTRKHAGFMIDTILTDAHETSPSILDRLFEILLIQVIGALHASAGPAYRFMAALQDRGINRAITAIHENPGHNWSVERLAEVASLSRSTFSKQFTELTGIPAMHYLTLWRMHKALSRLKAGHRDLDSVAHEVGYLSAAAFQKAFKRIHGFTPSQVAATCKTPAAETFRTSSVDPTVVATPAD